MEGEPFDRILEEAGTISSSQEEILRRSLFVRSARSHSSSSSSGLGEGSGSGPGGASYWISHRPVTMRSASDSHHSSSPSSSDARSGTGEVARPPGAEERPDAVDGGEGSGLPGNGGDRLRGRVKGEKSSVSKRKRLAAGRSGKRSCVLSDENTQEPEESPVVSSRGTVVAKRLGFSPSGKEEAETARTDGNPLTEHSVEDRDRSANDEFAQFRYVGTGVPPLRHSPPELLKGARGRPKSARSGTRSAPQKRTPVPRDTADGEVIKRVAIGSPQENGKGVTDLHRPSPSNRDEADAERDHASGASAGSPGSPPLEAGPNTSVQPQNSVQPEVEEPLGTGLGTSSPVETPKQLGGQRAVENSPSCSIQCPVSPTKSAPGDGDVEIRGPSDLVDLLLKFSKKPDKRLENVDFLDVLAMKGIHIPPPSWWRPGGYSSASSNK